MLRRPAALVMMVASTLVALGALAPAPAAGQPHAASGQVDDTQPPTPPPYPEPPFLIGEVGAQVDPEARAVVLEPGQVQLLRGGILIQEIPLPEGPITFPELVARVASPRFIRERTPGVFEVRAAIIQQAGSDLRLEAPSTAEVRLATDPGVFMGGQGGTLTVQGSSITSWDAETERPATDIRSRPFLRYEDGATVRIMNAELAYLGSDPVGPGVSFRGSSTTGQVLRSVLHHNIVGLEYSLRSRGSVRDTELRDNLSDGLLIASAAGPEISRATARGNRGVGIRLSSAGSATTVTLSEVVENAGGGISVTAASRGRIETTLVEDNAGIGIDVDNAASITVAANRIRNHSTGLRVGAGGGAGSADLQNNVIEGAQVGVVVDPAGGEVLLVGVRVDGAEQIGLQLGGVTEVRNATVEGSRVGVFVDGSARIDDTSISGSTIGVEMAPGASAVIERTSISARELLVQSAPASSTVMRGGDATAPAVASGPGRVRLDDVGGQSDIRYGEPDRTAPVVVIVILALVGLSLVGLVVVVRRQSARNAEVAGPHPDEPHPDEPQPDPPPEAGGSAPPAPTRAEPATTELVITDEVVDRLRALDEATAWTVGNAFASVIPGVPIVVGTTSDHIPMELRAAFTGGATVAGAEVVSVGNAGREAVLHHAGTTHRAAAMLVPTDLGTTVALYRPGNEPLRARDEGVALAELILTDTAHRQPGGLIRQEAGVAGEYVDHLRTLVGFVDLSGVMVAFGPDDHDLTLEAVADRFGLTLSPHADLDGPQPLTLVRSGHQWVVHDNLGTPLDSQVVAALAVRSLVTPPDTVVAEPTVSRTVTDEVTLTRAVTVRAAVGPAQVRAVMAEADAVLGVTRGGGLLFRGTAAPDHGLAAGLLIASHALRTGSTIADMATTVTRYVNSGDLTIEVHNPSRIVEELAHRVTDATVDTTDGVRFDAAEWWCAVRARSPAALQLVVEAVSQDQLDQIRARFEAQIADLDAEFGHSGPGQNP